MNFIKSSIALIILSTASTILHAADAPKLDCVLTDELSNSGEPGDDKDVFSKDTPQLFYVCGSSDVHKGQVFKGEWIAADTNGAAPANYKIDEASIDVEKTPGEDEVYTAKFSLSKPTKGWPVGSYHVDVYLDGTLVQSAKFTIS